MHRQKSLENDSSARSSFRCPWLSWVPVALVLLAPLARAEIPLVPDWSADEAGNTGFFDPTLGATRRAVFLAAAAYVGSLFNPAYPGETIRVKASFNDLGTQTVGNGAAAGFTNNFGSTNPRFQADTDYTFTLANHLAGRDLLPGNTVEVNFNSNPAINFDYGTNDTPVLNSGLESLYTTVVHEIVHGMGFLNYINTNSGSFDGFPTPYDRLIVKGTNNPVAYTSLSDAERLAAITSDDLYWTGPMAIAANGGQPIKLYAPNPYEPGSSISHLDTTLFDPQGLLLLPRDSSLVKAQLNLTALERAMFYEMGFTPSRPRLTVSRARDVTTVAFTGIRGANYRLRHTTTLNSSSDVTHWTVGAAVVTGTGGVVTLTLSGNGSAQFFAIETIP